MSGVKYSQTNTADLFQNTVRVKHKRTICYRVYVVETEEYFSKQYIIKRLDIVASFNAHFNGLLKDLTKNGIIVLFERLGVFDVWKFFVWKFAACKFDELLYEFLTEWWLDVERFIIAAF